MKVTKLEHSALLIEAAGGRVGIDPGSLTSEGSINQLRSADGILVSHRHGDHFDAGILSAIGRPVWGPPEVVDLAAAAGLDATVIGSGDAKLIAGFSVAAVSANHGPAVSDPLDNIGFIIRSGNKTFYFTGDMAGEQVAPPPGPFTAVAVPIEGGGFVFTPEEAADFLRSIGHSGVAIALHADGMPDLHAKFMKMGGVFCAAIAPTPGKTTEL